MVAVKITHPKAVAYKALGASGFAEHCGFVALAFVEVFQLGHAVIWGVSLWLLVCGAGAVVCDRPKIGLRPKAAVMATAE